MADGSPRTVAGAAGVFPFPLSPRRRRTCRLPRPLHRFRGGGQLPSGVSSISRRACEGGGRYRPRTKPPEIGRAHVRTPVTNAHLVCRLPLEKKKTQHVQASL